MFFVCLIDLATFGYRFLQANFGYFWLTFLRNLAIKPFEIWQHCWWYSSRLRSRTENNSLY